jgi:hypothetical protein
MWRYPVRYFSPVGAVCSMSMVLPPPRQEMLFTTPGAGA